MNNFNSSLRVGAYSLLCFIAMLLPAKNVPGESSNSPVYIIFDGSNSMWGQLPDGARKIVAAQEAFSQLESEFFEDREVALRLYGHRRTRDCSDTELVIPFNASNNIRGQISTAINKVKPRGKTLITQSLKKALDDFNGREGDILLISDGVETCDTDPCELVRAWRDQNVDIRIHVVGLGLLEAAREAMQCISTASGTTYRDANNAEELSQALNKVSESMADPSRGISDTEPAGVTVTAVDENGNTVPVTGTLSKPGQQSTGISSDKSYDIEGGEYLIYAGVPTSDGQPYRPISQQVTVSESGSTEIEVKLQRPPVIRTQFLENGKEVPGVAVEGITSFQKALSLLPARDYFVKPGAYEFTVDDGNGGQSLQVQINPGDDKTLVFEQTGKIDTTLDVVDKEGRQKFQELWQNGELRFKVEVRNGVQIQAGKYRLISRSFAAPYLKDTVRVAGGVEQAR